jgi:hypothetical protein
MRESIFRSRAGKRYRYDAFISYSHENAATIDWLARVLRRTWVPGRLPPRLFIDRAQIGAGGLGEVLERALTDSRFLIVCCSEHTSARPRWINLEIDAFAHSRIPEAGHGSRAILACRVGAPASTLPPALRWVQREREDELFLPDLTGDPTTWTLHRRKAARLEALSLLAPIHGLPDREALLARRTKTLLAGVAAACLAVLLSGAWQWWLTTAEGSFYRSRRTLLARAGQNEVADTPIVIAAAAFGRMNDRRAVETLAEYVSDETRKATVIAAGLASLPVPECAEVDRELQRLDSSAIRAWPEAHLLAVARCEKTWPEALADTTPSDTFVRQLAWAGLHERAREMAHSVPAAERVDAVAALVTFGAAAPGDPQLSAWRAGRDAHDVLASLTGLLTDMDVIGGGLKSKLASELLQLGVLAAAKTPLNFANTWELNQQLAAQLAGAGQADEALTLLTRSAKPPGSCPTRVGADGYAWRALALQRLGAADAEATMDTAVRCAQAPIPATRTWSEWRTIATVHALAGHWRRAFDAAEQPADERARILFAAYLIEVWQRRSTITRGLELTGVPSRWNRRQAWPTLSPSRGAPIDYRLTGAWVKW